MLHQTVTCFAVEPLTAIDVWDSAVKIGLGALISAFVTLVSLRRVHAHDMNKEIFRRRLEKIESIATLVHVHHRNTVDLWSEYRGQLEGMKAINATSMSAKGQTSIAAVFERLVTSSLEYHSGEAYAEMIGAPALAQSMAEYRNSAADFQHIFLGNFETPPTVETAEPRIKRVLKSRKRVFDELAGEFAKVK